MIGFIGSSKRILRSHNGLRVWLLGLLGLWGILLVACASLNDTQPVKVTLTTEMGDVVIALDTVRAPETSAFFLKQTIEGKFEGTSIFRAGSKSDVGKTPKFIEGGILSKFVQDKSITSLEGQNIDMLKTLESTNLTGLDHKRGAVSLARNVLGGGEVLPDIVFCLTDIPEFDYGGIQSPDGQGYPVFARVIQGMNVLDKIAAMERKGLTHIPLVQGQILTNPVKIIKVTHHH